jgi:hypothetical protein
MTSKLLKEVACSLLDLAMVAERHSAADTYHKSVGNALQADALGYT